MKKCNSSSAKLFSQAGHFFCFCFLFIVFPLRIHCQGEGRYIGCSGIGDVCIYMQRKRNDFICYRLLRSGSSDDIHKKCTH